MAVVDIEMASPIGPLVTPGYAQGHEIGFPAYQSEVDLCRLLQALSLTKGPFKALEAESAECIPHASQNANEHDANTEDPAYLPDALESSSSRSSSSGQPRTDSPPTSCSVAHPSQLPGCHFLQSILASLAPESPALSPSPYPYPVPDAFPTTNGAYMDTLLMHRGLLSAFPAAHRGCAATLGAIARAVELRAWRADRDSDAEAVAALRQEAHVIANWA